MRLGQLEPCEHDALRRIGGESLIRREIQIQRGVSRNWACLGIGRVTSTSSTYAFTAPLLLATVREIYRSAVCSTLLCTEGCQSIFIPQSKSQFVPCSRSLKVTPRGKA
jgi:hypothetical protein